MPSRPLRWILRIVAGVVVLVVLAAGGGYAYSESRIARTYTVSDHALTLRGDSAELALGERLTKVHGCADCHGPNLGGRAVIDDPAIGTLVAANLTRGGRGAELDVRDWERAVRHGVRRDGTPLRMMPAQEFNGMADDELAAIAAYVRSLPPVTATLPETRLGPLGRALFVANQIPLLPAELVDHARAHVPHVEPEVTPEYGEYLAVGCTGCHGQGYSGGKIPGTPPDWKPAANITPTGIGHYTEADFIKVLRTGVRPNGVPVDTLMPWRMTKEMTDLEIRAIYAFLKTVPAREYGNR